MPPTQADVDAAVQALSDEVTEIVGVAASAVTFINGAAARQQAALDAYKAANPTVTEAQVSGIQAEITALKAAADPLAAAIAANPA